MKVHSELPYLALLVNFVATFGLFRNNARVGFAAKPSTQLVIVRGGRQHKERKFQKYVEILTGFSLLIASKQITSVQLGDFINVLSVTNGVAKLSVTRNPQCNLWSQTSHP